MRKLLGTSFGYAIAALAGGVFYREFTKFNGFVDGRTTLGFLHVHLFMLGMMMFLVLTILEKLFGITQHKLFPVFYGIYNGGLIVTVSCLVARGVVQVLGTPLSSGGDAAISGVSGLGHIALGTGLILLFILLFKRMKTERSNRAVS